MNPVTPQLMPYAYNTEEKAIAKVQQFNRPYTRWTAKLSIGKSVGHSSINLYANEQYVGTLQGDILGPALYRDKNNNSVEGNAIHLTWTKVLQGIDELYSFRKGFGWGVWMCHDATAAVFRRWGIRNAKDVYTVAYGFTPGGRPGLVLARIAGLVLSPGTSTLLGAHQGWNRFQEEYMRFGYGVIQEYRNGVFRF